MQDKRPKAKSLSTKETTMQDRKPTHGEVRPMA